ncbi:MAG: 4-phosphoerythronate dehydrogenase [Candidatus Hydrogenedentes bacterium]|nr:4-phosphoerythronate dehydrogenase [Candidatus Hydrogenedentota bacterium]
MIPLSMLILADENIPYVKEAFREFGEVITISGREITRENTRDADVLLVRSITKVNKELLEGSKVKFVGTATIGFDHIDVEFLKRSEIKFASAPGSNANSVAEYVISGLLYLEKNFGYSLKYKKIGILGVGNVGSKVLKKVISLGIIPILYDPPLAEKIDKPIFNTLEEIHDCDIITLHVPLEKGGRYPTYHMINSDFFYSLKRKVVFINTSRGGVVATKSLIEAIKKGIVTHSIVDVWENEPNINLELLNLVTLATPHIAGYSFDGKVNGTYQLYHAFCQYIGKQPTWDFKSCLPTPDIKLIDLDTNKPYWLHDSVHKIYPIFEDDKRLREISAKSEDQRGKFFDQLRKNYPIRREFHNTTIRLSSKDANWEIINVLEGIGFKVARTQNNA